MSERFDELSDFIRKKMRMSHVYQPAMLIELLQNEGSASVESIAKSLLVRDPSQIEYYENITARISDDAKRLVLGENAKRLLRL